jgi:uncharacterized membrane protein YcaP (DUF421 family)
VSPELLAVAARALVAYGVLLALLRVSGKRTVAQGTPFDFVLALLLGNLSDDLLFGLQSAATFTVAASTLVALHLALSWAKRHSAALDRLVDGSEVVLVRDGTPVESGLRAEHLSEQDLEALLRLWGIPRERWGEVECAQLEDDGLATVGLRAPERAAVRGDLDRGP